MDTPGCPRTVFPYQAIGAGLASPALIHENQIFCEKLWCLRRICVPLER